jgi:hypothetical protein
LERLGAVIGLRLVASFERDIGEDSAGNRGRDGLIGRIDRQPVFTRSNSILSACMHAGVQAGRHQAEHANVRRLTCADGRINTLTVYLYEQLIGSIVDSFDH